MRITESRSIIIIDPSYIAKKGEWGKGEVFDWEESSVTSSLFSDYIWLDGVPEVVSDVLEVKKRLNEVGLINLVNDHASALNNYGNFSEEEEKSILDEVEIQSDIIGSYTTDSGCIGVFYLDEVLNYNPEFQTGLSNRYYTIINDFTGRIIVHEIFDFGGSKHVLGLGNKTFYTI